MTTVALNGWCFTNGLRPEGLLEREMVEVTNAPAKMFGDCLPHENVDWQNWTYWRRVTQVTEAVDHPKHYNAHPSGVECIDVVRHMNFNLGNVVKYLWRAGEKDPAKHLEDLKKAAWYLNDEIERLSKNG